MKKKLPQKNLTWLTLLFIVNLLVAGGLYIYHLRVNFNSEIKLYSHELRELRVTTPAGGNYTIQVPASDTVVLYARPIHSFAWLHNGSKVIWGDPQQSEEFESLTGISVQIANPDKPSLGMTIRFFTILRMHWPVIMLNIVLLMVWLTRKRSAVKAFCRRIKIRLFRTAIRHKPIGNAGVPPHSRFGIVLLLLALYYVVSLFAFGNRTEIDQISTERIRMLVSLEMNVSGNYFTPTINGKPYYNKPPLFNQLLIPVVDDESDPEYKARLITTFSILVLGFIVFLIARKNLNKEHSLLATLLFLSSFAMCIGYPDWVGLDPLFSAFVLAGVFSNYHFAAKRQYVSMYTIGYLFTVAAFLTKGLPALWFQLASLFFALMVFGKLKVLFSWKHGVGIAVFLLLTGSYFAMSYPLPELFTYFRQLFIGEPELQLNVSMLNRVSNMLSFAGKAMLAYAPVMLLFPAVFLKPGYYSILKSPFQTYLFMMIVSICVVFIPGNFQPHYILCAVPLAAIMLTGNLSMINAMNMRQRGFVTLFFCVAVALEVFLHQFAYDYFSISYKLYAVSAIAVTLCVALSVFFVKKIRTLLVCFIFTTITLRVIVVGCIPGNVFKKDTYPVKEKAKEIVEHTKGKSLFIYPENTEINHATLYYLTYFYGKIIYKTNDLCRKNAFFLSPSSDIPEGFTIIDSISQRQQIRPGEADSVFVCNNKLYLHTVELEK